MVSWQSICGFNYLKWNAIAKYKSKILWNSMHGFRCTINNWWKSRIFHSDWKFMDIFNEFSIRELILFQNDDSIRPIGKRVVIIYVRHIKHRIHWRLSRMCTSTYHDHSHRQTHSCAYYYYSVACFREIVMEKILQKLDLHRNLAHAHITVNEIVWFVLVSARTLSFK